MEGLPSVKGQCSQWLPPMQLEAAVVGVVVEEHYSMTWIVAVVVVAALPVKNA